MSGDIKYPAKDVRPIALQFASQLSDLCEHIELAGSLRKGKSWIGDVEIVVMPKHAPELLARLDRWVKTGIIGQARYKDGSHRWGSKYRGIRLPDFDPTIEVFLADKDNFGYILWLRTGPADANAYVMQQCIARKSPYRSVEGYWREFEMGRKLCVVDEAEMFRLLGMAYLEPKDRTLDAYMRLMKGAWVKDYTLVEEDAVPKQEGLL